MQQANRHKRACHSGGVARTIPRTAQQHSGVGRHDALSRTMNSHIDSTKTKSLPGAVRNRRGTKQVQMSEALKAVLAEPRYSKHTHLCHTEPHVVVHFRWKQRQHLVAHGCRHPTARHEFHLQRKKGHNEHQHADTHARVSHKQRWIRCRPRNTTMRSRGESARPLGNEDTHRHPDHPYQLQPRIVDDCFQHNESGAHVHELVRLHTIRARSGVTRVPPNI